MSGVERALSLLKNLPRVTLGNIKALPGQRLRKQNKRGQHGGRKCGRGNKGQGQRQTLSPIGYEGGSTPFHMRIPKEPYYKGVQLVTMKREYRPLSLLQLQRLIDLDSVDISKPIDLSAVCNTGVYSVNADNREFGINLVDEGIDIFEACINIEVQYASETVIAAIEKNGGTIVTKYYDAISVNAMKDPKVIVLEKFFEECQPIPRCKLPPMDALEYYSSACNRGYLADPVEIAKDQIRLAQKYGYNLPEKRDEMLSRRKDARQIWYGLQPGWVVNINDRCILKPTDAKYKDFYSS